MRLCVVAARHSRNATVAARVARFHHRRGLRHDLTLGGQIITREWTRLHHEQGPVGVPNKHYQPMAYMLGLLTYSAAQALMAWTESDAPHRGLKFRLVRMKLEVRHTLERVGYGAVRDISAEEFAATYEPAAPSGKPPEGSA